MAVSAYVGDGFQLASPDDLSTLWNNALASGIEPNPSDQTYLSRYAANKLPGLFGVDRPNGGLSAGGASIQSWGPYEITSGDVAYARLYEYNDWGAVHRHAPLVGCNTTPVS